MHIWELLGIEPTADIVEIKRAFARKAKDCHPEEYPEEYKNLRNAYKKAVEYARQQETAPKLQDVHSGTEEYAARRAGESGEDGKESSRIKAVRIEEYLKEEPAPGKTHSEKPHLKGPQIEAPRLEKTQQEAPHIEGIVPESPHIRAEGQEGRNPERPSLEKPHLEAPQLKKLRQEAFRLREPVLVKPPVKRPRIENVNLEVPSLKELMQTPVCEPPYVEDPSLRQPGDAKRRRSRQQPLSKELDFSFEEVERAFSPEEVDEFFYLFRAIASNPVLRDNIECWTLFLEQDELQNLFRREDVCRRMIAVIDKYFWGKRDTLLYFEFFLTIKTGKEIRETQSFCWKLKKLLGMLPKGNEVNLLTQEEAEVHQTILSELRKRNIAYDLIHFEAARVAYMEFFLGSVKENREGREQKWKEAQKQRVIKSGLHILKSLLMPLLIIILFLILVMATFHLGKGMSV